MMEKFDIAIENALVLTMEEKEEVISKAVILIKNNEINFVGKKEKAGEYLADKTIDASFKLVMPGFVNVHTHSPMTIFRGIADDMSLVEWLYENIFPLEQKYINRDTIKIGTKLSIIEMIQSGTTTFNDMYYFSDEMAEISKSLGIRAFLNESVIDYETPNTKTPKECYNYIKELHNKWKNDELINISVGVHSPYTCSAEVMKDFKKLSDDLGVNYNIHLAETKWEFNKIKKDFGKTPTEYLDSLGILDSNLIAAHCVHLTDNDIKRIVETNTGVAHNPQCNIKLASGIAPIVDIMKAGGEKIGIGTDGVASNNDLDILSEIQTAGRLHKLANNDASIMNAKQVVEMATIKGAKVLNYADKIGSIKKGKLADLIIIDLNQAHLQPFYNIYSLIAYSMKSSDIQTVIVNGKILMENNELLLVNEQEFLKEVKFNARKIKKLKNE